jgi:hypothetical protein
MWQTWQASHDIEWLRTIGWPVLQGIAEFWVSRLTVLPDGKGVVLTNAGKTTLLLHHFVLKLHHFTKTASGPT